LASPKREAFFCLKQVQGGTANLKALVWLPICHSGLDPRSTVYWIPAFAGMTLKIIKQGLFFVFKKE